MNPHRFCIYKKETAMGAHLLQGFRFLLFLIFFLPLSGIAQDWNQIKIYIRNADYAKAETILRDALNQNPKDDRIYYTLAHIRLLQALEEEDSYQRNRLIQEAKAILDEGFARKKNSPYLFLGKGEVAILEKNFESAKLYFDKALEMTGSSDVEILVTIADFYNRSEDKRAIDEATRILTRAQYLAPKNPEIYIKLGNTWLKQGVLDMAIQQYQEATRLDSTNVEAYYALGKLYLYKKEYNEAASAFAKAISLDPQFAPAYPELGELFYKIKNYNTAKSYYQKYLALRPNDLRGKIRYVTFLYLTKEYAGAVSLIEEIQKDTTSLVLKRLYGYCLAEIGKYEEAKRAMDAYFQVAGENTVPKDDYYYSKILLNLGFHQEAVSYFEKAISRDESLIEYAQEFGDHFRKKQEYLTAISFYRLALQHTRSLRNLFMLGVCYYSLDSLNAADSVFRVINDNHPDFLEGYLWRGRTASRIDSNLTLGLARPYFEKVVELGEKDPGKYKDELVEAYRYLGYYYYEVEKDKGKALQYYQKILGILPNDETAKEMVKFLQKR